MLIYLQFQTDIFFWKKESNKWSQTTETLIIKIDAKKKNPFIHVEISQRNIIKKIVTTNQRHVRLPTICWLMDTCAMSVNLYISNCECNSLANIDWIKTRIYFNFFIPFFFYSYTFFRYSYTTFNLCFRKRKQHVSTMHLPSDDKYINSTIRRLKMWCIVLFVLILFKSPQIVTYGDLWCTKLSVLFLFFIIAVSEVSENIDERIYLIKIYVSML